MQAPVKQYFNNGRNPWAWREKIFSHKHKCTPVSQAKYDGKRARNKIARCQDMKGKRN